MNLDEVVQKIYEERYDDPKHPETAMYLRDGMIREIAQRALELATGSLALDLVAARHKRNTAHEIFAAERLLLRQSSSPTLRLQNEAHQLAYEQAEEEWLAVVAKLDEWLASSKGQP